MSIQAVLIAGAVVSSLGLATAALAQGQRRRIDWTFSLGMLAFAGEALAGLLLLVGRGPADHGLWLRVAYHVGFLVPVLWGLFLLALVDTAERVPSRGIRVTVMAAYGLAAFGALGGLLAAFSAFAPSWALSIWDPAQQYGPLLQLIATLGVLVGLEAGLRTSERDTRWRVKYLVLGLSGIFLVRFYFLANILLFRVVPAAYLTTQTAALLVANVFIAVSLFRGGLVDAQLRLSRQMLYRSVVIGAAGAYLFTIGALTWLLNRSGISEQLFWTTLAVFVPSLAFASVLLSEDVRWRVTRFVGRHVYQSKYDYRDQWISFTKRLGSPVRVDTLGPELLRAVLEAVGARKGALYVATGSEGQYDLVSAIELSRLPSRLRPTAHLVARLTGGREPVIVRKGDAAPWEGLHDPDGSMPFADTVVLVPLTWQGAPVGLLLLGPERAGASYMAEDLDLLATVAEQAGVALATGRLSEQVARSREFEAFHRLTSFIIHDVKNAVSALSMLSRNAADNFEDPEFRQDAIRTLVKTVDRMNGLLARLSSSAGVHRATFAPCDIAALMRQTTSHVLKGTSIYVVPKLNPVPPVVGDAAALERVLENIIKNAVEAMDGHGQLTIRTEERGGGVACAISDTGRGMSPEFLRNSLFVPFRSTKRAGWGVGLFQAREIIEQHGGRIEVESEESKGSTFTIVLPAAGGHRHGT